MSLGVSGGWWVTAMAALGSPGDIEVIWSVPGNEFVLVVCGLAETSNTF